MPTDRELLESLRDEFEKLEPFDRAGLNSLRDRGQMIIRRVFGADSTYMGQLSAIEFRYTGSQIVSLGAPETPGERNAGSVIGVRGKESP